MTELNSETQAKLLVRLADGFAALAKQVDELESHNKDMKKALGYPQKVGLAFHIFLSCFCSPYPICDDKLLALDL